MLRADKIAIVGDLHGRYNLLDNDFLERAGFDLVLFVGDLGSGTLKNGLQMIRAISRLRVPGLLLPGNNDAPHLAELKAELTFQSGKSQLLRLMGPISRRGVAPSGFSAHDLVTKRGGVTLIAARPCAMGGSECSFPEQLRRSHGIETLEQSTQKLCSLVDESTHSDLIFLAHNGPLGLGARPSDLWGRDFEVRHRPDAPLDWGDSDLETAINHAQSRKRRVLAVIAGHMHRSERNPRALCVQARGTTYVNAACVPRVVMNEGREMHHFVEMSLDLAGQPPVSISESWRLVGGS